MSNMNITRYPNLREIMKYHPYSEHTVCDMVNIEPELLQAVLNGCAFLDPADIIQIAALYGCSIGVIQYNKLIMLNMDRQKHSLMAAEVDSLYMRLKYMAKCERNEDAARYLEFCDMNIQEFMRAAHTNQLSYGHWLGIRHKMMDYLIFATPCKRRELRSA